jgi:hypothetical protein
MARIEEKTVKHVDDFDGTNAAETVRFALDGRPYEIDLSKPNASELRRSLRPYVERARSVRQASGAVRRNSGAPARRGGTGRSEGYDRVEVRAWAKANRVAVSPRGRIASEVVEKWRNATAG